MEPLSAVDLLQQPVLLHGIQLGRPVDLLVETETWQALGFVVLCGDDSVRFLPYAASQPGVERIVVASALMLLDDVGFYEERASSLRDLLGREVERGRRTAGVLRDLLLARGGSVAELEVERAGTRLRVPAPGSTVLAPRATAA